MDCDSLEAKHYTRLLEKSVFVYNISLDNNGNPKYYHRLRAADWNLSKPERVCKLTVLSLATHPAANKSCLIQLRDDPGGQMFGESNLEFYSGSAGFGRPSSLIPARDSSRYFTLEIKKPSGEADFVGLGFSSSTDSRDLTECLENYLPSTKRIYKCMNLLPDGTLHELPVPTEQIKVNIPMVSVKQEEEAGDPLDIKVIKLESQPEPEQMTEKNSEPDSAEAGKVVKVRKVPRQRYWNVPKEVQQLVDIGEAHKFRQPGGVLRCHICPLIKFSKSGNPKPIIEHWTNEHQLITKSLICVHCWIIFSSKALAAQHKTLFHQNKCPHCRKEFANEIKLQKHMSTTEHGQIFQFKCEACRITFYTAEEFRAHASDADCEAHHPQHPFVQIMLDPAKNPPTEKKKKSKKRKTDSQVIVPTTAAAATGTSSANNVDPVEAEVEKLLAWGVAQRYRDRNSPTGNILHCLICPVTFGPISGSKARFTDLLLFHHWEHVHKFASVISCVCRTCSLIFSVQAHASEHSEMYHKNKCPQCPKEFPKEASLRMHVLGVHKTILQYDCQLCGLVFSTKPEFKVHLRSMHYIF